MQELPTVVLDLVVVVVVMDLLVHLDLLDLLVLMDREVVVDHLDLLVHLDHLDHLDNRGISNQDGQHYRLGVVHNRLNHNRGETTEDGCGRIGDDHGKIIFKRLFKVGQHNLKIILLG